MNTRRFLLLITLMLIFVGMLSLSFGALSAQDPTADPTIAPTVDLTQEPPGDPTIEPTVEITLEPTIEPTDEATVEPTEETTVEPTDEMTVEPTVEATAEATATATHSPVTVVQQEETCDADLILALYIAQHFFDFESFRDTTDTTLVDIDALDKGQYVALFTTMNTTEGTITVDIDDSARDRIGEIMAMDDADFDVYLDNIMIANATNMGDFTVLTVRTFSNEADDCASLREELRRFYLALVIVDLGLQEAGMDTTDTTDDTTDTDTTDTSTTDTTGTGDDLAEGAIVVNLSGDEEVPGPGDEDGSGRAVVYLRTESVQVCVDISVSDITLPASAAHIHIGARGESGPPVVPLNAPGENGISNTCTTVEEDLMQELVNNPQNYYINVHNDDFPAGAVRGQMN